MLIALDPNSREILWTFHTSNGMYSSPAISVDGTIYIGSRDDKLYAVNPNGSLKWTFTTGDDVDSSPAVGSDGTIYVGSNDFNLYAIDSDGSLKWKYATGGAVISSPAIGNDSTIYVGSQDGKLYAIEGNSGGLANSPWPMFRHDRRHTGNANTAEPQSFYRDIDGDGYGDPNNFLEAINQPEGYTIDNTDCNDNDADVYPGSQEVRGDNIDQDCDGTDLPSLDTYYLDNDGDSYGDSNISTESDSQPDGYVADNTDCDDSDQDVNPGSAETQNSKDDNCDGIVDNMILEKAVLSVPNSTTDNTTPTFNWQKDPYATWYQVYLQNGLEEKVYSNWYSAAGICSIGSCEVTPDPVLKSGDYKWWIKSWNEYGSVWSDVMSFTITGGDLPPSKITHKSPSGTISGTSFTFTWDHDPNSTWYKLWIGDPSGKKVFAEWIDASQICSENDCSTTIEQELSSENYEWYVKSWNDYGKIWSDGMDFTVSK